MALFQSNEHISAPALSGKIQKISPTPVHIWKNLNVLIARLILIPQVKDFVGFILSIILKFHVKIWHFNKYQ
jgi:hypothetical protein